MNERVAQLAARLKSERTIHGRLTQIANEAGITTRTLQKIIAGHSPNVGTLDELEKYFRGEKVKAASPSQPQQA